MRVVLIGFMATGKSSVAPKLAAQLGLTAIEMDDLIAQKGGKSIKAIFADSGESAFRKLETEVAKDLQQRDNVVISTGGGVVMHEETMQYLTGDSLVIELSGSFETLIKRISPAMPRPLFQDKAQAKTLYKRRRPLYSKYAALTINTDHMSVVEVVEAIAHQIQEATQP
jgi:shikimate kinase